MKKILIAAAISLGLTSSISAGACSNLTCDSVKVTEISASAWGTIAVSTDANEAGLSCSTYAGKYMYIAANAAGKNAQYSALLTAKTTKTPIRINLVADANGFCQISYIVVK